MWFWIVPLVVLVVALAVAGVILGMKIPQLTVIDVDAIPEERVKRVKADLIRQRVERLGSSKFGVVVKAGNAAVTGVSKAGRRAVQRLYKLEQYYQKLKQNPSEGAHAVNPAATRKLLDEAEALVREEEFIPAEKKYIEVISHNPKLAEAYEGLGNLYLKNKSYGQARETLDFTLRLSPEDASVHVSLADLEVAEDNPKAALRHLREAVRIRANNPKYLDRYIETSLELGETEDAKKGISRMKEVNPENQAISEWEERLAQLTDPSQSS